MSAKAARVSRKNSKLMVVSSTTTASKSVPLPKAEKKEPGIITQFINIVDVLREEADKDTSSESA